MDFSKVVDYIDRGKEALNQIQDKAASLNLQESLAPNLQTIADQLQRIAGPQVAGMAIQKAIWIQDTAKTIAQKAQNLLNDGSIGKSWNNMFYVFGQARSENLPQSITDNLFPKEEFSGDKIKES